MARYKANNGKELEAELFKAGMADDICLAYNKPLIYTNNKKKYVTTDDYIFLIDGENEKMILNKELFEKYTTLIK